jgi:hypothetical protein
MLEPGPDNSGDDDMGYEPGCDSPEVDDGWQEPLPDRIEVPTVRRSNKRVSDRPADVVPMPSKRPKKSATSTVRITTSALHGLPPSGLHKQSKYATNGVSRERMSERLTVGGFCYPGCQLQCHTKFTVHELGAICDLFWSLSSSQQAFVLNYLYELAHDTEPSCTSPSEEMLRSRTQWSLCGHMVCFPAFNTLLGTGSTTTLRRIRGETDTRGIVNTVKHNPQTLFVDAFWTMQWAANAEPLALPGWSSKSKFMGKRAPPDIDLELAVQDADTETAMEDWGHTATEPDLYSRLGNVGALLELPQRFARNLCR